VDSQGNIIVFGDKINYEHEDSIGIESGLVVKFDSGGNKLFYRAISSIKSVVGKAGCVTENDEILFIGWLIPPDELDWWDDTWLIKYNSDGDKLWDKTIGAKDTDEIAFDLICSNDGGIVLFGGYHQYHQNFYGWIVKTDSLGNGVYNSGWQSSITHVQFSNDINVYPNPTSDYVTVGLTDLRTNFDVYLYNMTGQLVYYSENNTEACKFSVVDLPEGMYIIKIMSENRVYTGKLSVKH
ncbi:MAG: T9SS type A sorting domain-containing protein, partial [Bacteroidales bacterium]|nr:T9SS type A sorting domain-containing protein [Bacteroidales bacterium]